MALASLVVAAPPSVARGGSGSSCGNNNSVQCCNQTYENNPTNVNYLSGLLGVILNIPSGGGLLGVDCSPITGLGTGTGANCVQQTVCCDNVDFTGLINIGCINININL